jgi:hypothetical protein
MIEVRYEEIIKWGQKRLKSYHILGHYLLGSREPTGESLEETAEPSG